MQKVGRHILTLIAPQIGERVEAAALERAEAKAHAGRALHLSAVGDGRVRLTGWLDTEAAATINAALDPLCAPRRGGYDRSPAQRRADALIEVCGLALRTGELPVNGGDRPHLVVTVPFDTLQRQVGVGVLDTGEPLSAGQVRRLACDAQILPAVLGGDSQPLDLGRTRRLITGPLRRALVLRDGGCAFPGCDRPDRWCHAHHIRSWLDGGPTSLDNAVLLCGFHHREIHRGHWQVQLAPDRRPEFTPPPFVDPEQRPRRNIYHRRC